MPDVPRSQVGVSFPAFQTPGGLLPQAAREHTSDYAETQGQAKELARRTDGVWLDLPYSPARCLLQPGAAGVWQVEKAGYVARYKVVGAELHLSFHIVGPTTAGASFLRLVFPERLRTRQMAYSALWGVDSAGLIGLQVALTSPGDRWINLYRGDASPWPPGPVRTAGQIVIEVEEV